MSSNLQSARERANQVKNTTGNSAGMEAASEVIVSLPDRWIDTEKVQEIIAEMHESLNIPSAKDRLWSDGYDDSTTDWVRRLGSLIAPNLPTLADMSMSERDERKWAQADMEQHGRGIITCILDDSVQFMKGNGLLITVWEKDYGKVTPLPDLPRLEWPSGDSPTVAEHANVAPNQQANASEIQKSSLPNPEDVPVNEVWKAEIGGKEYTAARIDPDSHELPWIYANKSWTGWSADSKVTLLEKLTPTGHALPEGTRLADHAEYGRVVVSPHTDEDGDCVIFRLSDLRPSGALTTYCKENELTFLDGEA